jgi:transcriptional regulator with XRE-family HTH domain
MASASNTVLSLLVAPPPRAGYPGLPESGMPSLGERGTRLLPELQMACRLRRARTQAKVTLTTMARALGVSPQQVVKYESGQNRLAAGRLPVWAALCGVNMEVLLHSVEPAPEAGRMPSATAELLSAFLAIRNPVLQDILLDAARGFARADTNRHSVP